MNKDNDIELLRCLNSGKTKADEAFLALYEKYSRKLYSYCLFKSSTKENAEEVFQETWIKFNQAAKNKTEISNVQAYLVTIAKNLIFEKYKKDKQKSIQKIDSEFDFDDFLSGTNLQSMIEKEDLISVVKVAADMLDEIYRDAFVMNKIYDMSYQEIAEITGETTDCIKKRVYRAVDMIKQTLKPYINELSTL